MGCSGGNQKYFGKADMITLRTRLACTIAAWLFLHLASCSDNLPKEKLTQYPFRPQVTETADSLLLSYENEVACPISFKINTNFADLAGDYATEQPIIVEPYGKLQLNFKKPDLAEKPDRYFSFRSFA